MPDYAPYPPSVCKLIERFAGLPGIGRRSAERMAYHVLSCSREEAMDLAFAIRDVKKNIRACAVCFHVAEAELCTICANPRRDQTLICVVELPRDIIAMEKAGGFAGAYHVLQGHLSPADGIGPQELRIAELQARIARARSEGNPVAEVILAMNPTTEGDATAAHLAGVLRDSARVTRLARGLASGTDLESAAPTSLQFAIEGRREI